MQVLKMRFQVQNCKFWNILSLNIKIDSAIKKYELIANKKKKLYFKWSNRKEKSNENVIKSFVNKYFNNTNTSESKS